MKPAPLLSCGSPVSWKRKTGGFNTAGWTKPLLCWTRALGREGARLVWEPPPFPPVFPPSPLEGTWQHEGRSELSAASPDPSSGAWAGMGFSPPLSSKLRCEQRGKVLLLRGTAGAWPASARGFHVDTQLSSVREQNVPPKAAQSRSRRRTASMFILFSIVPMSFAEKLVGAACAPAGGAEHLFWVCTTCPVESRSWTVAVSGHLRMSWFLSPSAFMLPAGPLQTPRGSFPGVGNEGCKVFPSCAIEG